MPPNVATYALSLSEPPPLLSMAPPHSRSVPPPMQWGRRKEFDHIVIETTGLANPAPIISSFFMDADLPDRCEQCGKWGGQSVGVSPIPLPHYYTLFHTSRVRLDGVVTVVDAYHVTQHLDEDKGEGIVNEAVEQIAYADRILLNKVVLVRRRGGGGGGRCEWEHVPGAQRPAFSKP